MRPAILATAALLAAAPALAEETSEAAVYPNVTMETDLGLYGVSTTSAPDADRRGTSVFLFGEVSAGLQLAPGLAIQGVLTFEPIGEGDSTGGRPHGGVIGFRRQATFLEALFVEWKPDEALTLQAGRFVAPFSRGYEDFPGILTRLRADGVQAIEDSLGVAASWTFLSDPRLGDHALSGAVFTLDRSALSSTFITRPRCCDDRYERFSRNTEAQGGPGNNGRFDNASLALDADGFAWLPGFSYHLALVSRGQGVDGTAREWGYAAALRHEHRWSPDHRTLLFAEGVQFRNAGGRPRSEIATLGTDPVSGAATEGSADTTLSERRTFTTLGAQHRHGDWRGVLAWQRDQRKRSLDPLPTENYVEVSIGRDLGNGFGLDVGYQWGRYAREETRTLGTSHAVLMRLGYSGGF